MFESSHSLRVIAPIPPSLTADEVISALHIHDNCLTLQAYTIEHKELPTTDFALYKDPYFSNVANTAPIKTYEVTESAVIIPGIGDWGRFLIHFPAWFQDTASGLKTCVRAMNMVTLQAEYRVLQNREIKDRDDEGGPMLDAPWVLVEEVTVKCSWWLMLFVKGSMEGAHKDICKKLLEKIERAKLLGQQQETTGTIYYGVAE